MAKGRLAAKLVLAAIPVTAAGLALWFLHAAPTADGPQLLFDGAVLAAAVLVLCVMVLWLLYGYIRWRPRARRLGRERQLLSERAEFLEGRLAILQVRAFEDGLTGLGSRGLFDERLDELVALSLRKNQALSLILLDIDNFKNVNDTHGHPLGDHVLRDVAAVLKQSLRRYDSAYRYGGEELAVLLPQTRLNNAVMLAERVREALEAREFSSRKIHVTASFGAATLGGETLSPMSLVALADRELYRAKALGRNRVEPASRLGLNRLS